MPLRIIVRNNYVKHFMRLPQIILLSLIHLLISQNIIFAYKLLYYMKCNVFIIKLRQFECGITFFLILNFSFDIKLGTQIIFLNDAIYLQWWNFVVFILQVSISVWSVRIDFYFSSNKLYLIFILGSQATSTFYIYKHYMMQIMFMFHCEQMWNYRCNDGWD